MIHMQSEHYKPVAPAAIQIWGAQLTCAKHPKNFVKSAPHFCFVPPKKGALPPKVSNFACTTLKWDLLKNANRPI